MRPLLLHESPDTMLSLLGNFPYLYPKTVFRIRKLYDIGYAIPFVITCENGSLPLLSLRCGDDSTRLLQ